MKWAKGGVRPNMPVVASGGGGIRPRKHFPSLSSAPGIPSTSYARKMREIGMTDSKRRLYCEKIAGETARAERHCAFSHFPIKTRIIRKDIPLHQSWSNRKILFFRFYHKSDANTALFDFSLLCVHNPSFPLRTSFYGPGPRPPAPHPTPSAQKPL